MTPGLLKIFAVNFAIAAGVTLLFFIFAGDIPWVRMGSLFISSLVYSNCIGGLAYAIVPRLWSRMFRFPKPWNLLIIAALLAAISLAGTMLASGILIALGIHGTEYFWTQYFLAARVALLITAIYGGSMFSYHYYQCALAAKDLEKERALKLAALAQISSLESRIHPHFLFNTLNSISALIPEDPRRAELLIERVSALLRFSLDSANRGLVPLEQEMKIVTDYLEIEKTRFDSRLSFLVETAEECHACMVPPLSVQTLVENSVKHAIAPSRKGGRIDVRASFDAGRLRVEVAESGPGFTAASITTGHGLDILRSRLAAQFEARADLNIDGSRVTLWIPA